MIGIGWSRDRADSRRVMGELCRAGLLDGTTLNANGRTLAENCAEARSRDERVIRPFADPCGPPGGRCGAAIWGPASAGGDVLVSRVDPRAKA